MQRIFWRRLLLAAPALFLVSCGSSVPPETATRGLPPAAPSQVAGWDPAWPAYADSIRSWREAREARYRSDRGWLTIVGLHPLLEGENAFGREESNDIVLPLGPERAGFLVVTGDSVTLLAEEGVELTLEGEPVTRRTLASDEHGPPDRIQLDRLRFWVIERAGMLYVRVQDPKSPILQTFRGIDAFPIDSAWRVRGRLVPDPGVVVIANQLGYVDTVFTPGPVEFSWKGEVHDLLPTAEDESDSALFFVFSDETTGIETYGAGRMLVGGLQPDGTVMLDFNLAYNPPCAWNPNTTCPLPPEGNHLPVRVEAGEKAEPGY